MEFEFEPMGEGIWRGSDQLSYDEKLENVKIGRASCRERV